MAATKASPIKENTSANRVAKEQRVSLFGDELKDAEIVVVTQQSGLNADQTRTLRVMMRQENVGLKVGKNTLVRQAIKGTKLEAMDSLLRGPTALAFSKDPIAAAKASVEFAKKNNKFKVIGAVMGDKLLDANEVKTLASLPSLDQLRGKLIGLLLAPATKIAGVLQAPAGQLARVMSARSKQSA